MQTAGIGPAGSGGWPARGVAAATQRRRADEAPLGQRSWAAGVDPAVHRTVGPWRRSTMAANGGCPRHLIGRCRAGSRLRSMTARSSACGFVPRHAGGSYPRILGQIGNKAFTLEGCHMSGLRRNLFGGPELRECWPQGRERRRWQVARQDGP
jgi:hypothetical protein